MWARDLTPSETMSSPGYNAEKLNVEFVQSRINFKTWNSSRYYASKNLMRCQSSQELIFNCKWAVEKELSETRISCQLGTFLQSV